MRRAGLLSIIRNPAQLVVVAFTALILIGTVLLLLPAASDDAGSLGWENSLFLSTSATTVTGLSTVDISTLSLFGELVVLALIQIGGFGIMTIGSVFALVALRRVGLRQRMLAQAEIGAVDIGELARLLKAIARITIAVEGTLAMILFVRFWQSGVEDTSARRRVLRRLPCGGELQQCRYLAVLRQPRGIRRRPVRDLPGLVRVHRGRSRLSGVRRDRPPMASRSHRASRGSVSRARADPGACTPGSRSVSPCCCWWWGR